ncbi:hypothetical protein HPB47_020150 [Ixodes persulcatus]|uniref:Uncharacterized protein n=1 Tax=Ixodes persulcatus TaxID=34615 RepID=A0AC60QGA1_IXOPE|nr:hypothetical protein HPB47_020150 [Ixodes persulcatus]
MSAAEKNAGMLDSREVTEALLKNAFSSDSQAPAPDERCGHWNAGGTGTRVRREGIRSCGGMAAERSA